MLTIGAAVIFTYVVSSVMAWRVCSVYHATYSLGLAAYYVYFALLLDKSTSGKPNQSPRPPRSPTARQQPSGPVFEETRPSKVPACLYIEVGVVSSEQAGFKYRGILQASIVWPRSWRNISPDGDPDMELGLHATLPPLVGAFLYIFCRIFFYIEDFISIRQQPVGVYTSMNKSIPFMP